MEKFKKNSLPFLLINKSESQLTFTLLMLGQEVNEISKLKKPDSCD
jgi:hypothetical protein